MDEKLMAVAQLISDQLQLLDLTLKHMLPQPEVYPSKLEQSIHKQRADLFGRNVEQL